MQRAILLCGEECDVWGLGHSNFETVPDFEQYDVIINLENYDTGWVPSLNSVKSPLKFLWAIDCHVRGYAYYKSVYDEGKYSYILQPTKYYIDNKSLWFPNCYDDDYIKPNDEPKRFFVGFCGNYINRKPCFDYISKYHNLKLDINVRGQDMVNAINSYEIQFNKNIANDVNYRNFETMGCKTALLTDYDPQYDELGFKNGENVFFYRSMEEAVDILKQLEKSPETINKVALTGHELVLNKHTFKKRANSLIKFIKKNI